MSGSQREERKNEGGKGTGLFNPKDIASAREGGTCNQCSKIPACQQQQQSEHRPLMFGQPNPSCPPWLPQAMHKLLQAYTQGHLPWVERLEVCAHAHMLTHSLSCPTLYDPMDYSPPGSSVHEIFLARMLEWVANSSSRVIFPTQGSNQSLLHWEMDSLPLSHLGSPGGG